MDLEDERTEFVPQSEAFLLAGYSGQAFQAMGDPMLLPSIAAVVVGGTKVTGGEGNYLGTVVGVMALTLLSNVLSFMQAPEALRLVIYGSNNHPDASRQQLANAEAVGRPIAPLSTSRTLFGN